LDEESFTFLTFEVQLLIQFLCTGKKINLLWSTGEGVIFREYKISTHSLKILDALIDLHNNSDSYTPEQKRIILKKLKERSSLFKIITNKFF
jgi:hypothetical protein